MWNRADIGSGRLFFLFIAHFLYDTSGFIAFVDGKMIINLSIINSETRKARTIVVPFIRAMKRENTQVCVVLSCC